jgi:hypothetical protein
MKTVGYYRSSSDFPKSPANELQLPSRNDGVEYKAFHQFGRSGPTSPLNPTGGNEATIHPCGGNIFAVVIL